MIKPYPEYKDSCVEWIGEMPSNWDLVRNKNIFSKSKNIVGAKWKKYPVLSLTKKGVIIKDIERNEGKMPSDFSIYQIVKPHNLLMCLFDIDVTPRCVGYINNKGIVSAAYSEIAPITDIYTKYYYYWYLMLDFDKQLLHLSKNLRNSLSNEDFMALPIVKPSLEEQQQITSFLDKKTSEIDKTIEKDTLLIELLQEKRTALINHVVTKGLDPEIPMKESGIEWIGEIPEGWEVKKIKDVASVRISNVDKKSKPDEPDVLLCNYTDVYNNDFITSDLDFMKATANFEQIKKLSLLKDDVIITKDSESPDDIAVPTLVNEHLDNVVCGYHLALIRPNNAFLDGNFLFRSLESKKINDQFVVNANGVTRFGISTYPIKNSYLIIPSLKEQIKIVNYLENQISNIDKTIIKINENIRLLQEYKKSLIHHVVTGKVNVIKED
jgi:type I restriction enzyme S subunit